MTAKLSITLNVNGRDHRISVEPRKTLVDAIREDCGQTGTHIGCEHGVCGACTVIVGDGTTLHPLQRAFMAHHSLQCGFCTPGFLMLAASTLEKNPDVGDEELLDVLASNLCRCTGYANIVDAVKAVRDEMKLKAVVAEPG